MYVWFQENHHNPIAKALGMCSLLKNEIKKSKKNRVIN